MKMRPEARKKPGICFVSLNNFPVLSASRDAEHIGGAEVQQKYIALGLAGRGYPVSFVTLDHGQQDGLFVDGVRVFKAYAKDSGIRRLRFIHPRCTGLWAAMRRAGADVYYQRTASDESGEVCAWCRLHGRRFVFAAAHDSNCDPDLPALQTRRERLLYRYALRGADAVIAQTDRQQEAFLRFFGRRAVVIRNCCPSKHVVDESHISKPKGRPRVLWAGRFSPQKRLEWCLDLAEQLPQFHFDVVGGGETSSQYARGLRHRGADLPNVTFRGVVPHRRMPELYERSSVVLSTSRAEGFPNVFLEAWSRGRPVVGTVDPDGVIAGHRLGCVAQSPDGLRAALLGLLEAADPWREYARNALRYVASRHSIERILEHYERLFRNVMRGKQPQAVSPSTQAVPDL